jgi:transcription antitermination factor NusA-like protein
MHAQGVDAKHEDQLMPKMVNVCHFCLKSGILCPKCQTKLKKGEISKTDLDIGQLLLSLENTYPALQDVYFHKAVETDGVMALIVGRGDVAKLLGYGGKILKAIGEKVGKNIRILEQGVDERKFLEDLFAPLNIITINTIWLPDGSQETRVILRRRGRRSLPVNVEAVKQIAQKVRGITLRVEFAD